MSSASFSIITFNIDKDAPIDEINILCDQLLLEKESNNTNNNPLHHLVDIICLQEVTQPFYELLTRRLSSKYVYLPHHDDASSGDLFHSLQGNVVPHLNCIFLLRTRVQHSFSTSCAAARSSYILSSDDDEATKTPTTATTSNATTTVELMSIPRKVVKFGGSRITAATFVLFEDEDEEKETKKEQDFYSNTISLVNLHLLADTSKRCEEGHHQQVREEQIESLGRYLDLCKQQERHAIIVGDFNYDRDSESRHSRNLVAEELGMIDAVQFQHPGNQPITWKSKFEDGVVARLDRVLVHNLNVLDTKTIKLSESDHLAVYAKLEIPSPKYKVQLYFDHHKINKEEDEDENRQKNDKNTSTNHFILYEGDNKEFVQQLIHQVQKQQQHQFSFVRKLELITSPTIREEKKVVAKKTKKMLRIEQEEERRRTKRKKDLYEETNHGNIADHEGSVLIFKYHELTKAFHDAFEQLEEIGVGELMFQIPIDEEIIVKRMIVFEEEKPIQTLELKTMVAMEEKKENEE